MPSTVTRRPFTSDERTKVEEWLAGSQSGQRRAKEFLENAVVHWAVVMLISLAVLGAASWVSRRIGWESGGLLLSVPVIGVVGLVVTVFSWRSSSTWLKGWKDFRPLLREALHVGVAEVETYTLTACKRYQEPEHGGLIYLARADDHQVLCLYDKESQDLGVQDQDPLSSSFRIRRDLQIVRVPAVGWPLEVRMTGDELPVESPKPLNLRPQDWPEADRTLALAWDRLDEVMALKRLPADVSFKAN